MAKYHAGRALEYEIKAMFENELRCPDCKKPVKGEWTEWDSIRGAGSKGSVDGFRTDLVFSKRSAQNERVIYLVLMQAKRKKL